jgi:hypothetical protein
VYQRGFDEMGRPKTMVDAGTQTTIVGSATYGAAGELLTMGNETRLQVTRITHGVLDLEYKYSATQNNGRITAMKDWTSGEEVNYAHDEQAV